MLVLWIPSELAGLACGPGIHCHHFLFLDIMCKTASREALMQNIFAAAYRCIKILIIELNAMVLL